MCFLLCRNLCVRLNSARVLQELAAVLVLRADPPLQESETAARSASSTPAAAATAGSEPAALDYTELCFARAFTDLLNTTLLTSAELFDLRTQLRTRAPPVFIYSYTRINS